MRGPAPSGHLPDAITCFARALRAAGLPVGPGSVLDAVAAVEIAGVARRDDVREALRAVFVTRREHGPVFDGLFAAMFARQHGEPASADDPSDAISREARPPQAGSRRVQEALRPPRAGTGQEVETTLRLAASDHDALRGKDFAQMSAEEIARAKRLVAALVMPDDRRRTRRLAPDPRGARIDMRATLRDGLRGGGGAVRLARRSPVWRAPPIVALVDVSGSMAAYSRLVLHLLHALAAAGRRVRCFAFATRLTPITRDLSGRDPDEALARAGARVTDWEAGTRIAPALAAFNRDWSRRVLGGGATVLLFTDGLERDPGDTLAAEMARLHRSCRRLVWLNPLLRFDAFAPKAAGIRAMLPHVDAFRPIHSLRSMEQLVAALAGDEPVRRAASRAAGRR